MKKIVQKINPHFAKQYKESEKSCPQEVHTKPAKKRKLGKKIRRKREFKVDLVFYLLMILISSTVVFLAFTLLFKINNVYVAGCEKYDSSEIISLSGIEQGTNLLLCDKAEAQEKIFNSLPYIESVSIKKRLPSSVEIDIKEGKISYVLETDNEILLISCSNRILEQADEEPQNLLIIKGAQLESTAQGDFVSYKDSAMETVLEEIKSAIDSADFQGIRSINVSSLSDIMIDYEDRVTIKIGDSQDMEYKFLTAKEILENKINKMEKGTLDVHGIQEDNKSYFTPNYVKS